MINEASEVIKYAAPTPKPEFSIPPDQLLAFAWELDERDLTGAIKLMLSVLNKKRKGQVKP